jgi:hypothetical protein
LLPKLRELTIDALDWRLLPSLAPALEVLRLQSCVETRDLEAFEGGLTSLRELRLAEVVSHKSLDLAVLAKLPALRTLGVVLGMPHRKGAAVEWCQAAFSSWAAGWRHITSLELGSHPDSCDPMPVDVGSLLPVFAGQLGSTLRHLTLDPCTLVGAKHSPLPGVLQACLPQFVVLERLSLGFDCQAYLMYATTAGVRASFGGFVVTEPCLTDVAAAVAAARPACLRAVRLRLRAGGRRPAQVSWGCCMQLMAAHSWLHIDLVPPEACPFGW